MVPAKASASQSSSSAHSLPEPTRPRPTPGSKSSDLSAGRLLLKALLFTFLFWLLLMIATVGVVAWWGYQQVRTFTTTAGTSVTELKAMVEKGWREPVTATNDHKNILILGVDSLAGRGDAPPLTDTMMIASVNLKSGRITLLPLPRDLWSDAYQTKINALYAYGAERNPSRPAEFPQTVLTEMTGIPFHHVVVLSIDQVAEIIDILGGIDVTVEESFVDEQFPRPDVDVTTERDPAKLYQRIEFTAGTEHMSGERALQYIRSRHSSGTQGGDLARSRRQELVLAALMTKTQQPETLSNVRLMAQLYKYYVTHFSAQFSLEQGIATARALWPHRTTLQLQPQALGVFPSDPNGVLVNPPVSPRQYQGQWVYTVRDSELFKTDIQGKLF